MTKITKKKSNSSNAPKNAVKKGVDSTFISENASIQALVHYSKEHQDELIALAKKQTDHIIRIESELLNEQKKNQQAIRELVEIELKEQIKYSKRGQLFAFWLVFLGFGFAFASAYFGISWLAIASALGALGTIAAQFLGKNGEKKGKGE